MATAHWPLHGLGRGMLEAPPPDLPFGEGLIVFQEVSVYVCVHADGHNGLIFTCSVLVNRKLSSIFTVHTGICPANSFVVLSSFLLAPQRVECWNIY